MKILVFLKLFKVVIDELHLMLRIFDVLIRNLIYVAVTIDKKDISKQHNTQHVNMIVTKIVSCGVTFRVSK